MRAPGLDNGRDVTYCPFHGRFSSTIILVMGGSPGRLVMRHPMSRAPDQAGRGRSGDGGLGQGQPVGLEEPGEEVPDGGAAVVEDVVAAAAGAVVDGEADGVDEVVDVGGDDAVPAAVDQAQLTGA